MFLACTLAEKSLTKNLIWASMQKKKERTNKHGTNKPGNAIVSYTIQLVIVVCYAKFEASSCVVPEKSLTKNLTLAYRVTLYSLFIWVPGKSKRGKTRDGKILKS